MSNGPLDVRFVFPETNAVSLGGVRPIAWMGLLIFATGGGFALRAGEVWAASGLAVFVVPCIYLLFAASARYAADDGALRAEPYR